MKVSLSESDRTPIKNLRKPYEPQNKLIGIVFWLSIGIAFSSIYAYMYFMTLHDVDPAFWEIETCNDLYGYVNLLDETKQTRTTVKQSMEMLQDCISSIENNQSIKIIKTPKPKGENGLDADIRVVIDGVEG